MKSLHHLLPTNLMCILILMYINIRMCLLCKHRLETFKELTNVYILLFCKILHCISVYWCCFLIETARSIFLANNLMPIKLFDAAKAVTISILTNYIFVMYVYM